MNTVTIFRNAVDPTDVVTFEAIDDVCDLLTREFARFPDTAKIYHRFVATSNDVTPHDEAGIDRLQKLEGHFYVVVWPEGLAVIIAVVAIALAAVAIGLAFIFRANRNGQNESSPNNELSDRQNRARPNERIPDIVGTVRSTPDLLTLPYKIFIANEEFEHAFMCIGRKDYAILDCKDDTTPVDEIDGEYVAVFGPHTAPGNGLPQIEFGTAPSYIPPVQTVIRSTAVNGQILRAPNSGNFTTNNNVAFKYGGIILTNDPNLDFTEYFTASTTGNPQYLSIFTNDDGLNASDPAQVVHSVGLAGTYQILSVTSNQIVLSNAATVNANWNILATFSGQQSTYYHTFRITSSGDKWVGPIVLNFNDMTEVIANVVAQNGLYYIDNKGRQGALTMTVEMGVQAVDGNLNPIGDEIYGTANVVGSALTKNVCGTTLRMALPTPGPCQVRMKLISPMGVDTRDTYSQEIQWRDLYAVSDVPSLDFGDVTTVLSFTATTPDSLTVKDRKLNLLVTRKLPTWINRTAPGAPQFSTTLYATNNAADIICALALDPYIGRRTVAELDVAEIYGVADVAYLGGEHVDGSIAQYFGTFLMSEFCYTFDDSKISFEEMLGDIGQAICCIAYRSGSTIGLSFEKATTNSKMLFNHRNKLPHSETRTLSFGLINDNDGIDYTYVNPNAPNMPEADSSITMYVPASQSAQNPKQIQSVGVRNPVQAYMIANRMFAKLQYANLQTKFTATSEASLRIINDRILVADNTRTGTQDGDVLRTDGLVVYTSQPITFETAKTYTAFLQLSDDTVQAIPVTPGPTPLSMTLSTAPLIPLVYELENYARTTYIVVDDSDTTSGRRPLAFLLSEKEDASNGTFNLTCINYSSKYYAKDLDLTNGTIQAPLVGYSSQGYIGIGLLKADGTTYTPASRSFSSSTYNGSTLYNNNNVPSGQQVTTAPPGSTGGLLAEIAVNGTDTNSIEVNLEDSSTASPFPTGAAGVKWQQDGDTDKRNVTAYVPAAGTAAAGVVLKPTVVDIPATAVGNFTLAHGLGRTPTAVLIEMTSGGAIWFQTTRYDATNLYLTASDSALTGKAQCF